MKALRMDNDKEQRVCANIGREERQDEDPKDSLHHST